MIDPTPTPTPIPWPARGWPTLDEWQTIAGLASAFAGLLAAVVAIIGVVLAVRQLRAGAEQLRLSAVAAERAADAEEAQSRPYISVSLHLDAIPSGNPKQDHSDGLAFIVVECVGRSGLRNLRMSVDPPFQTSGSGKAGGDVDPVQKAFDEVFSGEVGIRSLAPGQRLEFLLDLTSKVIGSDKLPQLYFVRAQYSGPDEVKRYTDEHVIDLRAWSHSIMRADPLAVTARQLRRLNENLEGRRDKVITLGAQE